MKNKHVWRVSAHFWLTKTVLGNNKHIWIEGRIGEAKCKQSVNALLKITNINKNDEDDVI